MIDDRMELFKKTSALPILLKCGSLKQVYIPCRAGYFPRFLITIAEDSLT
jgi:hypothetical protein